MNRTAATITIAIGLGLALAAGTLFALGHGLAATLCLMVTITCGVYAFRQPV